jgi:heme oxygenase
MQITSLLKESTAALHQLTEDAMPLGKVLRGDSPFEDYGRLLSVQYQIYQDLERHLSEQLQHPDLKGFFHPKHPWAAADLESMGLPLPPHHQGQHPAMTDAFAVGLLYVLEGSMLGGQVILKMLKKVESLDGLPHHFYTAYGAETGQRWMAFKALSENMVQENCAQEAVAGANYAFGFFLEKLEESKLVRQQSAA